MCRCLYVLVTSNTLFVQLVQTNVLQSDHEYLLDLSESTIMD